MYSRIGMTGKLHSEETKLKISQKKTGVKTGAPSVETRNKISQAHKGKKLSPEHREKLSLARRGRKFPEHSIALMGRKLSVETRKKMSIAHRGEKSVLWRDGITPVNAKIRNSLESKLWREAVFLRDDYTCQFCKKRGGNLEADHIKAFATHPELRFAIDNGRTLCKPCHKTTDTHSGKTRIKNKIVNDLTF